MAVGACRDFGGTGQQGGEQRPDAAAQVLTAGATGEGAIVKKETIKETEGEEEGEMQGERERSGGEVEERDRDLSQYWSRRQEMQTL